MAVALQSVHPTHDPQTAPARRSTTQRKEELARVLVARVEQGYRVESQTDTGAVLLMAGRRRKFGFARGTTTKYEVAVDEHGRLTSRKRSEATPLERA